MSNLKLSQPGMFLIFKKNRPNCRAGKEFSPTISLFFLKTTAEVSRNNYAKWHWDSKFP